MGLDIYDEYPKDMILYLKFYGWHFNKKMCEFAISNMNHKGKTSLTKELIDRIILQYGIKLINNLMYDYIYVANMAYHDYYGSSIINDEHLAKFIKDYIDDEDGYEEIVFSRFYIDCVKKGIPIDWENML